MAYFTRRLALLAGVLLSFLGATVSAQLIVSEREITRQSRTEWLLMKKHNPQLGDPRVQAYVRCIAGELIKVLEPEWQNLTWEVVVFDNNELNAFVLPGGKIGVFSGIFRVADTPDSLAAVIGHEIAHMTEGHVMSRARTAQVGTAGSIIASAATGIPRDYFQFGAQIGLQLPFQRGQEGEADIIGLEYMAKAGFDPRAGLALWQNMETESKGRNRQPEWLSTHPREYERIDEMVPLLVKNLQIYNAAQEAGNIPACYPR